jgi:hypothetical protein
VIRPAQREIAVSAAELPGSFMVANIFGMTPPAGTQPIKNESSRCAGSAREIALGCRAPA